MNPRINPDRCVACTTCVAHCPVAEATTEFLGPRMIGPAFERFRLMGLEEEPSLHYCANCKNCDIACPHGVPVSGINMLARAAQCEKRHPGPRDWMLAHGETMARLLRFLPAGIKNFAMRNPLGRMLLDALGIDRRAPLPAFARKTFRQEMRRLGQTGFPRKAIFFPGCLVDIYDPQTGLDMVWLMNRAGYEVIVPDNLSCCGLPMIANGFLADARANAARNLAELRLWRKRGLPLVTACPSCALMFNAELPLFFPDLAERYGAAKLEDAQEFLLHRELPLHAAKNAGQKDCALIYHAPCHLRAQGNGMPAPALLRCLPGVHTTIADAGCCGISGSYGFKKEKYEISLRVGAALFKTIRGSAAAMAVSECGTCRIQIRHGSGKPCLHPASIIRRRLEGAM